MRTTEEDRERGRDEGGEDEELEAVPEEEVNGRWTGAELCLVTEAVRGGLCFAMMSMWLF